MYRARAVCTSESGARGSIYIQHEGGTIPCTVKTMRELTCMDRLYKSTARLASAPECSTVR